MSDTKLDDGTEICIDNLLWDYAGFIHSPAPEQPARERLYDIARNALRDRVRELVRDARKEASITEDIYLNGDTRGMSL